MTKIWGKVHVLVVYAIWVNIIVPYTSTLCIF